jgi:hypothetical protein
MNSDEVNWLLQTIEDPENAKRFVQAQYQRGRIPYHVMASLARDRNWTDWPAVEKPAALISMECITTRQKILAATAPDGNRSDGGARLLHKGEGTRVRSGGETWRFNRL